MSLNEKFGHGNSDIRKVTIHSAPDAELLQTLLRDLSDSTTAAQCDVSWQDGNELYTLVLNHSRHSARAGWKLYSGKGVRPVLLFSHATNDVSTVHRLVSGAMAKQARVTQSQVSMSALRHAESPLEERRAFNISSNVSGKLRKLFIEARKDIKSDAASSISLTSKQKLPPKSITEFIDMTPAREILQNLFMSQSDVFSYPTFLFFLEREYRDALENQFPISLIIFRVIGNTENIDIHSFASPILTEIAKRIKSTQRKTDIIAQYADNQFALLLPETSLAGAKTFVSRVIQALSKTDLMPELTDNAIQFSFGIASVGKHCPTLSAFLFFAEKALISSEESHKDIICDQDILSQVNFNEHEVKPLDLTPARKLLAQLVFQGIFTFSTFLVFLEHEYYRMIRKERELLIMLLKVRVNEETFDEDLNTLPLPAHYEVIKRIGLQLSKQDIFAQYKHNNFAIMRPNSSATQMESLAKRLVENIVSEEWLTPDYPASSIRTSTQICIARAHPTAANLFCFVPIDEKTTL